MQVSNKDMVLRNMWDYALDYALVIIMAVTIFFTVAILQ